MENQTEMNITTGLLVFFVTATFLHFWYIHTNKRALESLLSKPVGSLTTDSSMIDPNSPSPSVSATVPVSSIASRHPRPSETTFQQIILNPQFYISIATVFTPLGTHDKYKSNTEDTDLNQHLVRSLLSLPLVQQFLATLRTEAPLITQCLLSAIDALAALFRAPTHQIVEDIVYVHPVPFLPSKPWLTPSRLNPPVHSSARSWGFHEQQTNNMDSLSNRSGRAVSDQYFGILDQLAQIASRKSVAPKNTATSNSVESTEVLIPLLAPSSAVWYSSPNAEAVDYQKVFLEQALLVDINTNTSLNNNNSFDLQFAGSEQREAPSSAILAPNHYSLLMMEHVRIFCQRLIRGTLPLHEILLDERVLFALGQLLFFTWNLDSNWC